MTADEVLDSLPIAAWDGPFPQAGQHHAVVCRSQRWRIPGKRRSGCCSGWRRGRRREAWDAMQPGDTTGAGSRRA